MEEKRPFKPNYDNLQCATSNNCRFYNVLGFYDEEFNTYRTITAYIQRRKVVRIARCSSTRRDTCDLYRQELHRSNWVKNCGNLPAAVIIILTAGLPSTMASRLTAILRNSRFGIKL
ncbi:hypothetical protein J6590_005087 [Homalodisca vitripennis]|nr:hypothetical protein J6590_005087 [Homalodisca vitripennis]